MTDRFDVYDGSDPRIPRRIATAHLARRRGRLAVTLTYDENYLGRPDAYPIDPQHPLRAGPQHTDGLPGSFQDCSPDRWGRNLIAKRARVLATAAGERPPALDDADYVLGVSDLTRQGALRFTDAADGPFLAAHTHVPQLVELPRLLAAAHDVDASAGATDDWAAVKTLLDAGTGSLGGARPKASVRDGDRLLMAKFPHQNDSWDVMAWEWVALEIGRHAGIEVPDHRLVQVEGHHVHLLARFDRDGARRLPYLSAMTLLGAHDGYQRDYEDIAEALADSGGTPRADLGRLWRRIALGVALRNTDDHLRNHGFLRGTTPPGSAGRRTRAGWQLSPAFDINPTPDHGRDRATAIAGATSPTDEIEGLRALAATAGLDPHEAQQIAAEVVAAAECWPTLAAQAGIPARERTLFSPALGEAIARLSGY